MPALFHVNLRAPETSDQEIPQPLFRAFQIMRRIHRPQDVVGRNLAVKRVSQALKSRLPDGGENVLLFHSNRS